jgi:cold shock CspA family protein
VLKKGTVKFWNEKKGFGFVIPDDGGNEHFVHISKVEGNTSLSEGQVVRFDSLKADRGDYAINIRPLSEVPSLVRDFIPSPTESGREIHDVFISHAYEDKDDCVRPLAAALLAHGLNVWYDEMTLKIGDSLRQEIDKGLANSKVGLVVLSPSFIKKGWTKYELNGIVTRSVSGEQILLPIWHKITKQQVVDFSPSIADKVARSTATHTIEEIAKEIAELIESKT